MRKELIDLKNFALAILIIGALNWGLIGFFGYDLIAAIFGGQLALISRIIYAVVGLFGLYAISFYFTDRKSGSAVSTS